MSADGSASLLCNTVEMGQGCRTVLTQIICEELGLSSEKVSILDPDVSVAPFDTGTFSSRSTFQHGKCGSAGRGGSEVPASRRGFGHAGCGKLDLEFKDGYIAVKEMLDKSVPLAQAVRGPGVPRGSLMGRGVYQTKGGFNKEDGQGLVSFYWMSAGGGAEVEVDRETGSVKVTKYLGIVDVGKAINPANIEQQNIGSIVMALGHTFTERMIYDDKGVLLNPNFVDYKIPTVKDLPDQLLVDFLEVPNQKGPYGAKGIGEVMIIPPAPAIANALYRATGIRFKDLPVTQERVLSKLLEREREKKSSKQ